MPTPPTHPLLAATRAWAAALDEVAGLDPLFADGGSQQALLVELTRLAARVTALRAQVLAASGDLAAESGARSAATVLAVETRTSHREASAAERLGMALRERWTGVGDAVGAGSITWEQACVLVRSLDDLPRDLDPELRAKAEAHLVTEAGHFEPAALRRLGRHVLEVVAPTSPTSTKPWRCLRRNAGPARRRACTSAHVVTARQTCMPGCPTTSRPGSAPTWTPTPHRDGWPWTPTSTGFPCPAAAGR